MGPSSGQAGGEDTRQAGPPAQTASLKCFSCKKAKAGGRNPAAATEEPVKEALDAVLKKVQEAKLQSLSVRDQKNRLMLWEVWCAARAKPLALFVFWRFFPSPINRAFSRATVFLGLCEEHSAQAGRFPAQLSFWACAKISSKIWDLAHTWRTGKFHDLHLEHEYTVNNSVWSLGPAGVQENPVFFTAPQPPEPCTSKAGTARRGAASPACRRAAAHV